MGIITLLQSAWSAYGHNSDSGSVWAMYRIAADALLQSAEEKEFRGQQKFGLKGMRGCVLMVVDMTRVLPKSRKTHLTEMKCEKIL